MSAAHLKYSVDQSLINLQTDYIDLYQMHIVDPLTPIEETLRALDDIVTAGKVRYIGCSNFMAWEMVEAIHVSLPFETTARNGHLERLWVAVVDETMFGRPKFSPEVGRAADSLWSGGVRAACNGSDPGSVEVLLCCRPSWGT